MVVIMEYPIHAGKGGVIQLFQRRDIDGEITLSFANGVHYLFEGIESLPFLFIYDEVDSARCSMAEEFDHPVLPA